MEDESSSAEEIVPVGRERPRTRGQRAEGCIDSTEGYTDRT